MAEQKVNGGFHYNEHGNLYSTATIDIYSTALHYYHTGCSRAAMQALKGIRKNKFLPGTHLLHQGRERQLWTKYLV